MAKADAAHASGDLAAAERFARSALAVGQGEPRAKLLLGVILAKMGRTKEAESLLQEVLKEDPRSFVALYWLSRIARRHGEAEKSLEFAEKAVLVTPRDPNAILNLAQSQLATRRFQTAAENLEKVALAMPDSAPVFHYLGAAKQNLGREAEATEAFKRAIAIDPRFIDSRLSLGQLLVADGQFEAAIEQAEAILKLNPNAVAAHHLLVEALIEDKQEVRAEAHLRDLIERFPNDSRAHATLGLRLIYMGRMDEARASLMRSIEIQPVQGFAYCNLALNVKITENDRPLVKKMEELAQNPAINPIGLSHLHYGLGKAYDDLGQYEQALQQYDQANQIAYKLKFGGSVFDRKTYADSVEWKIKTFNQTFLKEHKSDGLDDAFPILVVGMMRSGTTLTEQILSSHPQVGATGEQSFWPRHWQECFPQGEFKAETARGLAKKYTEMMHAYAPECLHATDKLPGNYAHLGLIHTLLPNIRVIHTMRNPVDTCLSIYVTPNSTRNEFAHNRANIVFAYRQYLRFMEHWRTILPPDRLLEFRYEDLVADRETITRKMITFCGLEWDDRCLKPEDNERNVVTPSVWQVRQPVYKTSVERWRRYEPWLGPFADLLDCI